MGNCLKKLQKDQQAYANGTLHFNDDEDDFLGGSLPSQQLANASPEAVKRMVESQLALQDELDSQGDGDAGQADESGDVGLLDREDRRAAEEADEQEFMRKGKEAVLAARQKLAQRHQQQANLVAVDENANQSGTHESGVADNSVVQGDNDFGTVVPGDGQMFLIGDDDEEDDFAKEMDKLLKD